MGTEGLNQPTHSQIPITDDAAIVGEGIMPNTKINGMLITRRALLKTGLLAGTAMATGLLTEGISEAQVGISHGFCNTHAACGVCDFDQNEPPMWTMIQAPDSACESSRTYSAIMRVNADNTITPIYEGGPCDPLDGGCYPDDNGQDVSQNLYFALAICGGSAVTSDVMVTYDGSVF